MRQGQGSKRSRGRGGGRRSAPQRHQNFDSNGPSIRIRGNANQVYEKYLQLARDATTAGDRVTAENMFQHAEHYFRVLNIEERENQQTRLQNRNNGEDEQSAQPPQPNRGNGAENRHPQRQPRHEARPRTEDSGGSDVESGANDAQPMRQDNDMAMTADDATGAEDIAPRRPRPRRNNGPATSLNRETVDAEASNKPALAENATEAPAAEQEPEKVAARTEKQSAT